MLDVLQKLDFSVKNSQDEHEILASEPDLARKGGHAMTRRCNVV